MKINFVTEDLMALSMSFDTVIRPSFYPLDDFDHELLFASV